MSVVSLRLIAILAVAPGDLDAARVLSNAAPLSAHGEYPRPTMVRPDWVNLNDVWNLSITRHTATNPGRFVTNILVPFPVESALSGIGKAVSEFQRLWYRREFNVPASWRGKRVFLHCEAVDWDAEVRINGRVQGRHKGGYDRFSFDITDSLNGEGPQELLIAVIDPSDSGFQPRGKQVIRPDETFYTASSGIWQTVWMEPVPELHIKSLSVVPDIDRQRVQINVFTALGPGTPVRITAYDGGEECGRVVGKAGSASYVPVLSPKLWSPSNPFLYSLKVELLDGDKVIDEVGSYFGMRKISVATNRSGRAIVHLNDRRVFQWGPLDHGFWPTGNHAAPSDEAMRSDIEMMKRLGFNMCRKHVKVDPERWYYWCDTLGLLVWQDMPNGDRATPVGNKEIQRSAESAEQFERELAAMIVGRAHHPSIVMWIPFNQGWGQYDTPRITDLVKTLDPTRLVISASGWHDMGVGDVVGPHQYPGPPKVVHDGRRAAVIGECGGFALIPSVQLRNAGNNRHVTYFTSVESLARGYDQFTTTLRKQLEADDLSGAVFTQWTDVEMELDGFLSYDRSKIKIPEERIRAANERLVKGYEP